MEPSGETTGRVYEVEGTLAAGTHVSGETQVVVALNELRLAVLGIVLGVGLSAAGIGLAAGGWVGGLVAGIGSVVAVAIVLRTPGLRRQAMRLAEWFAAE